MSRYNITIISHSFPVKNMGATGIFVKDQADCLSESANINVIAPKPRVIWPLYTLNEKWKAFDDLKEIEDHPNYRVYRPGYLKFPRKLFYVSFYRNMGRAAQKYISQNTDLFHVHFAYPGAGIISGLKNNYPDIPVVLHVHGNDWYINIQNRKIEKIIHKGMILSDRIITVGNKLKNDITSAYPMLKDKIDVVHNGIDLSVFNDHDAALGRRSGDKEQVKLLTVANFVRGKGLHILLKALKDVKNDNLKCQIIGNNPDPVYYSELVKLRSKLGLESQVEFIEAIAREDLIDFYSSCDFFVLPSLCEGFGIVLIEALSFGKPVISTYSGGPEDIVNERNGILVEPNNIGDLAKAIRRMTDHKDYDPKMISREVKGKFNYRTIRNELLAVYRKTINQI
ncbi:MAG: glycosyltransferase [Bacteroidales bacterium]